MERKVLAGVKKKAELESYTIFYADEASVALSPSVSHTYARRGQRPVISLSSTITQRLYLSSAISPDGDFYYQIRDKPFDAAAIVRFLEHLLDQVEGKVMVIWDNAAIHDCHFTRDYLQNNPKAQRLYLAKQPPYCPEVNPDEMVWNYLKSVELKNTCTPTVQQLTLRIHQAMKNIKAKPELIKAFFRNLTVAFYS